MDWRDAPRTAKAKFLLEAIAGDGLSEEDIELFENLEYDKILEKFSYGDIVLVYDCGELKQIPNSEI